MAQVLGSNVGNEVFYGALYYGLKVPSGTAACTKREHEPKPKHAASSPRPACTDVLTSMHCMTAVSCSSAQPLVRIHSQAPHEHVLALFL